MPSWVRKKKDTEESSKSEPEPENPDRMIDNTVTCLFPFAAFFKEGLEHCFPFKKETATLNIAVIHIVVLDEDDCILTRDARYQVALAPLLPEILFSHALVTSSSGDKSLTGISRRTAQ